MTNHSGGGTPTARPEDQCYAATVEELCKSTLAHYDDLSTKACCWNNQVPQAIEFWFLKKPQLERELSAARSALAKTQQTLKSTEELAEQVNTALAEKERELEQLKRQIQSEIELSRELSEQVVAAAPSTEGKEAGAMPKSGGKAGGKEKKL
jgi:septal ring factor EnvC (AmiA/AmiB activator)